MGYRDYSPEEAERLNREYDAKHGYGSGYSDSDSGVTPYEYTHPGDGQQQMQAAQPDVAPYLANVRNVINLKTQYDADPNFADPFAPREAVNDTYTYLSKTKYRDMAVEDWIDLDANDVFFQQYLSKMPQPTVIQQPTITEPQLQEYIPKDAAQKAILEGDKGRSVRDWNQLSGADKFIYGITPSSNVATNAPEVTKITKGIVQAAPLTMIGAKVGTVIAPGLGTAAGALLGLGVSYYQTLTGNKVPIAGDLLEALDKPGQWVEQTIGYVTQAGKRTWDWASGRHKGTDTRMLLEVLGEMAQDSRQMWEGGKYFMETTASPLLDVGFDTIRRLAGQGWSGVGQVIDPVASDKPIDLPEGTYGPSGMENVGKLWSDLVDHGYSEQVASDMIASGMFSLGGTSWMWADLIGQEAVDPMNAAPYFTNTVTGKLGNILQKSDTPTTQTFGKVLSESSNLNKGSFVADAAPFPLNSIISAITGKKQSGGLDTLGELMKNQFRTEDIGTLGGWAKRMAGIDPSGKLAEYNVTDPQRKFNWFRKQAELMPESKAIGVNSMANDTLTTMTFEAQDSVQLRAAYDQMANLNDITPGSNSTIIDSAETRTIAEGLREGIQGSNATIMLDQFDATITNRNTLNAVAADLQLDVDKAYQMLRTDPDLFTRRVNDFAATHEGMIGGVEVASIEPQLKVYTGDSPVPYSLNEVKALVNASVIDKMSDYYVKAYGIKPDGLMNKLSDTMKNAQSLLLLGVSPSYYINNVANNYVTQAAVGVLGFMSSQTINDIRTRMGITPTRMGESLAEMRGTDTLSGINKKIQNVKISQKDVLDKANRTIKKGNDKLGVFSKLSGNAEQKMGDQAIAVGINQYWKKRWKKGTGFPEMPVELVALIEAQTPGMSDAIYSGIERGMNMSEIRQGIFGTYIKPGAGATVESIIGRLFPDDAGLYDEIFVKTGLADKLDRELKYADTDAEIEAAVKRVTSDLESFVETKRQIDLASMSDNFQTIFEKEGLPAVTKMLTEAAITRADVWIRVRNLWESTYQKVEDLGLKRGTDEYKNFIANTAYEADKAFAIDNEKYSQAYSGMLKGLSVTTEQNATIMKNVLGIQEVWTDFHKQQSELMKQYYAMKAEDESAWAKTQAAINGLYADAFQKEIEMQTAADYAIADAVQHVVDGDVSQLSENMQVIRAIRERMRDWQLKTREKTDEMTYSESNAYYRKHNPEYNAMIQEIRDLQVQNGQIIESNRMNAVPNRKKATMSADDTVKMQHAAKAADVTRERAKVDSQGYLDQNAVRDSFIDSGYSEAVTNLMMSLYDARAKQWELENPGKNFYTEALRIREITREVGGEHGLLQNGKVDYKRLNDLINDNGWDNEYSYFGIRSQNHPFELGDMDHRSTDAWNADNLEVGEELPRLNGVSVTGFLPEGPFDDYGDANKKNMRLHFEDKYYDGKYVALIAGTIGDYGDDPGEIVIADPVVLKVLSDDGGKTKLFQWETIAETDIDTPQFKQAFGKTKVVDESGSPKVVYHGSPNAFEEFSYKFKGAQGSSEGYGFYFSDDISIAEGYAKGTDNIYKSYVNIEKPLNGETLSISKAQLKKLLAAIDEADMKGNEPEHWFLSDYGDIQREGMQSVLKTATDMLYDNNTNDIDLLAEIINTSGDAEKVYRTLKQVLGYDGIITKWAANDARGEVNIYIPFLPEQIKSVYNKGTWDVSNPNMLFQTYAAAVADGSPWYSHMETVIADKFPEKMNAQSVRNWLIKQGVTKQELQWTGMDEYLDSATGQVTKADLQRVVDMDRMKIEEVDIGENTNKISYGDWAYLTKEKIDAYDNEIDSLISELDEEFSFYDIEDTDTGLLKETGISDLDDLISERNELWNAYWNDIIPENVTPKELEPRYASYITDGDNNNYIEKIITLPEVDAQYQSNHWGSIDNPVFHVRFDDRIDPQGRKILFIEEFQSDWAQHLKDGETAPLADVWERKAIQRMMNYAADGDYDMVAWAPGSEHLARYRLGTVADEITFIKGKFYVDSLDLDNYENTYYLEAYKNGKKVFGNNIEESNLADYIGKQKADQILNSQEYQSTGKYTLTGDDLKIGDTWALKFYDQDIANATQKIIKRYGSELETTLIDTGNGNMLEVQAYKVTPSMAEPQKLFQAFQHSAKGSFEVLDGDSIIRLFNAKDISTMVHESGHAFRRTLSESQMNDFTKWAGFDSAETFRRFEHQFQNDYKNMAEVDRKRYVDAEEKFARGWEQYLIDGSAPSIGLKAVFQKFTNYLLGIYQNIKNLVTKDYTRHGEFVFDGQVLNINAEINGVKLRDIFDSMLTDKTERTTTYMDMISKRMNDMKTDNARLDDVALYRKAILDVNNEILAPHGSLDQARQVAEGMGSYVKENGRPFYMQDGAVIDDIALYDAIASAESLRAYNPFGDVRAKETRGNFTTASGINNARKRYEFQYKVIDLNDVTPSHTWNGNQLLNNHEYNASLQPRSRSEMQSVMQIDKIASNLSPDLLLADSRAIDRGSPIVGFDNNVESGNGRVLALLRAKDLYPEAWENYQAELKSNLSSYGIDPESVSSYENPILVRERITDMDAVEFAREANKPVAMQMTAKENAMDDAKLINNVSLANMDILPTETIAGALDAKRNAGFVVEFMKNIPDNEAAQYSYQKSPYEFVLNEAGRTRIVNALFAKVYGDSSEKLLKSFTLSTDSNIKAVESALKDSLPQMAKVEGLIQSGNRPADYSIAADVAIATQKLSELRKTGVKVDDYINQIGLPGLDMELTPVQNQLLGFFAEQRNAKKIREFLRDYAAQVEKQADVDQGALFDMTPITKEDMMQRALAGDLEGENVDVPPLFQMAADSYQQNNQTRFDDGLIVPDADTDNLIMAGALNAELQAEYDAFLSKFENVQDQIFARKYYDWYLSGQEGDAPKAANMFTETKVLKQAETYTNDLQRYKKLYDKGVEVDPLSVQPVSGTYIKRTYAFNHGDYVIAGNVYHDGNLVAYLPANSPIADVSTDQFMASTAPELIKTITVGDESFRVIGIDTENPKRLVYLDDGIVRSVEPGVIDGVEVSEFAEHVIRPGKQDAVPVNMPEGYALNELKDSYMAPVMNEFLSEYNKKVSASKSINSNGLNTYTQDLLNQYLDNQIQSKMQAEKYRAQKYGYMKKDQAMLNYDRRYGFDSWMTMMMPYQFWYTRSMYNWANRMIDTPGIFSMYARIKEMEEKNKRETRYPTRFDGRISVYAPYLPSHFGDRFFIDPYSQLFPFSQFSQNAERIADSENQITQAAKAIIEEQAKMGHITPQEREQALSKQGGIWGNAFAQAKMESGKDIGLTGLAGSYFTGPVFLDWYNKIRKGKEDQLTPLPITRTGNAIRGILDDTALSGLGEMAQTALSAPERIMRKLYGAEYNEFGSWGNGAIQKQLASMVGNGEINAETGEIAALEKDGNKHWDEAVRRAREENLYKVPSAGAVNAMVNFMQGKGSIREIFTSLALVPFGGLMYPEGERKTRDKYPSLQQAYADKESGKNPNAVNEWHDANPDWSFRNLMFNDDPDDLLRKTMIGNLNDMYYGLPYSQQQRMKNVLGPDFTAAFINKETRNYEAIPTDQLVEWVVKAGGKIPNIPDLKIPEVQPLTLYPESFANPIDEFYRIESEQYSQEKMLEKVMYALPKEQQKDFKAAFPQLDAYWIWKRSYKDQHPELQAWQDDRSEYFNEEMAINTYAEMSERTRDSLRYTALTDTKLSSAAMLEIKHLYGKHANPSFIKDIDAFIDILKRYR